jgi:CheY-like chemotaxis protein
MTDLPRSLAGLHVLLVDDDELMRDLLTTMLELAGARVTTCANGAEALDVVTRAVPDVIVMDINMPGPSGFRVMRTIRDLEDPRARTVPSLAISGSGDPLGLRSLFDAVDAGFHDFLRKPFRMESFVRAVGRAAGRVT